MRSDMAKVLIEDARSQSGERSRKWGLRIPHDPVSDYEEFEKFASSARRRQYGHNYKTSTDVLGPLRGYLASKIGQPWDAVYSEICANMDKRSTVGAHIFTHLWQYVDTNCWIGAKTGAIYSDGDGGTRKVESTYAYQFYVHPHTGLLCKAKVLPSWRRRQPKAVVEEVPISEGKSYKLINGVWFYSEWSKVTLFSEEKGWRSRIYLRRYEDIVIHKKRQLGKKELRDLKLRNLRWGPKTRASES